jgi:hypothetical protein
MRGHEKPATDDYNTLVDAFKQASDSTKIDTIVSHIKCGTAYDPKKGAYRSPTFGGWRDRGLVVKRIVNSSVNALQHMQVHEYDADGNSTPLFDSVGEAIKMLKAVPDYDDLEVSFLILATTDGEDNDSPDWKYKIEDEIKKLIATDRWTIVFRVPPGYKSRLIRYGIPEGNVTEWNKSAKSVEAVTAATVQAVTQFYTDRRKSGIKSSRTFYNNVGHVPLNTLQRELTDVTHEVRIVQNSGDRMRIDALCNKYFGEYEKGTAFYRHDKREEDVQDNKKICIRHKNTFKVYSGAAARDRVGLPQHGTVPYTPSNTGEYEVYIQSTSNNRMVPKGSSVLVWKAVRNL